MMAGETESFNMLYIILVLFLSITGGRSFPQKNDEYGGNIFYKPHQRNLGFRDYEVPNSHEPHVTFAPIPGMSYGTFVPMIEGKPIFIPDMATNINLREMPHRIEPNRVKPKTSWSQSDEVSSSSRRSPVRRNHFKEVHEHRRKGEIPTRHSVTRPTNQIFHRSVAKVENKRVKPVLPDHIKEFVIPEGKRFHHAKIAAEESDHPMLVEVIEKKEKPATNFKPSIHLKPNAPEEIFIDEDFEHPVVAEALVKKERHATHGKSSIRIIPEDSEEIIIEDEYDDPVVVEALVQLEQPSTHGKPVIHVIPDSEEIIIEEEFDDPLVVEALVKKEKPITHGKPAIHAIPYSEEIVIEEEDDDPFEEALARKEKWTTHKKPSHYIKSDHYVEPKPDDYGKSDYYDKPKPDHHHVKPDHHVKPKPKPDHHVKPKPKPDHHHVKPDHHVKPKPDHHHVKRYVQVKPDHKVKDVYPEVIKDPDCNGYDANVEDPLNKKRFTEDSLVSNDESNEKQLDMDLDLDEESRHEDEDQQHPEMEMLRDPVNDDSEAFNIEERLIFPMEGLAEGSGSVSEISEDLHGRSFLPVDPSIWSLMSNIQAQERQKFKKCLTPKNESGNCMPIQLCSVPNVASSIEEMLKNVCVIDEIFMGICCPEFPVETVKVDWDKFEEEQNTDNFIEGDLQMAKECGKLPTSVNQTVAWPWIAPLVVVSTGKVFCGGALISEQYVLSAAHCTTRIPRNRILIRLGPVDAKSKTENFEVIEIKRHAQYSSRTMQNDIALLKLSRKVKLGDLRRVICLPEEDKDGVGETGILLSLEGFSEKTKELETLPVIPNEDCQNKMGVIISDSVLCTMPRKEETKCNDDSGAPLVLGQDGKFQMVGILKWNRNDCDERFPSMFTKVSKYRKWIDNHAV